LCAGPYAHKRLSTLYSASIVSVGEPKLDSLYEEGFISKKAEEIFATLSKDKKVLLYMPTFGVLSSTKVTLPALVDLLQDYTIVIKLHHMTKLFSPEEMKYFEDPRFVVIDESVPVTDALKLSDIVISDNSGSIFDALVAKKGLVLIDSIKNKESFFTESPFFLYQSNNDVAGTVTSEESLEQIIKKEGVAPVVGLGTHKKYLEVGDLRLVIESAKNENYVSLQQKLVSNLYSHLDGDAGLRSANEIAFLVGKTVSRDKTLERYVEEFSKRIILENSYFNEEVAKNRADMLSLLKSIRILPLARKLDILYKIFIENKK
jgi:phosphatidylglycerophosphatase A